MLRSLALADTQHQDSLPLPSPAGSHLRLQCVCTTPLPLTFCPLHNTTSLSSVSSPSLPLVYAFPDSFHSSSTFLACSTEVRIRRR